MKHALFPVFFLLLALSACVSSKKYKELEAQNNKANARLRDSTNALRNIRALYGNEQRTNGDLAKEKAKLQQEIEALRKRHAAEMDEQLKLRKKLEEDSRLEISNCEERLNALQGDKVGLEKSLAEREKKVRELEKALSEREALLKKLEADLREREQRVKELEDLLSAQKQKLTELRDRIRQALRGFEGSNDITVEEKDGKVYVSLSQKLLFATGSKVIDRKGKEALAKLSEVLVKNSDLAITVEGHTDSDGEDQLNWDLSVGRATAIVAELLKNGVDPTRITAAGRGKHAPKVPNNSPENKAINRRSEIILSPDLNELFKLLED
jgi:chemotaxis protein MotB